MATATPGRGYFLQRQLDRQIDLAAEEAATELAALAYTYLASHAADAQVSAPDAGSDAGIEVLKVALLVSRDDADSFLEAVQAVGDVYPGLSATYSGPWPPYSFATLSGENGP
jgi:hypothetical protein